MALDLGSVLSLWYGIMYDSPKDLRFFKVILSSIADGVFTVDSEKVITSFKQKREFYSSIGR